MIDRKEIGQKKIVLWLKHHNLPRGFQTMCYNCNCAKAWNGNKCPHQTQIRLLTIREEWSSN